MTPIAWVFVGVVIAALLIRGAGLIAAASLPTPPFDHHDDDQSL